VLVLGSNERYRAALELAAARTGLDPAVVAAVINAEAAPLRSVVRLGQLTDEAFHQKHPDRQGRPLDPRRPGDAALIEEWLALYEWLKGSWDERSSAGSLSSARGATQFLAGTWVAEARRAGTYLNAAATARGHLDAAGDIVAGRRDELLDLRYDRTMSVVGAAEYDQYELQRLTEAGALPAELGELERAHHLYLGHHEGFDGALAMLTGTLTDAAAAALLEIHVGDPARRRALVERHGGESAAYQAYLWDYIRERVRPDRYRG
jgi:hypothetical protein